jgi:hypothetical protein
MPATPKLKTCENGHQFYESSDCPVCEKVCDPETEFLKTLGAPARRALENNGTTYFQQLS